MSQLPDAEVLVARRPLADAFRLLREAARGTRYDYTSGAIGTAIFLLAVPMVLEMAMESVFAVVDVFWVGHLGPDAVATVGLTESIMIIVYTVAVGLSIGATAVVARRIGEHDPDAGARAAVQALLLGAMVAALMGALGAAYAPQLLAMMGASGTVLKVGSAFTRVMLGGSASAFLLFVINAVFRGAGDAATAMRVLWLANAINIGLGPLLIFGVGPFPRMGVTGAAVATTIGRGTGFLFALTRLVHGTGHLSVRRKHLRFEPRTMVRLVRLSAVGTFQVMISSTSWIGLIRIIASFGSAAMAGYTIAIRVALFALLPAFGLSNAAATMVGQSLGAGRSDRADHSVWTAARFNLVFLGLMGVAFVAFAHQIVGAFTSDAAVIAVGVTGLRAIALGFPFFAYGMVLTQAFNGAGDTWTPTWINVGVFWLWEIPVAWFLATRLALGPRGVFLAVTIAYSTLAVVSALLFRRGRWRTKAV